VDVDVLALSISTRPPRYRRMPMQIRMEIAVLQPVVVA
jgi:hypothetical protein